MSEQPTSRAEAEYQAFVLDATSALEHQLGRRPVRRDFATAVAHAHAADPEKVPATMIEQASAGNGVVELRRVRTAAKRTSLDGAIDTLVGDARAALDAEIEERSAPERAPLRRPVSTTGRIWLGASAALALAAAVMVAWIGARELTRDRDPEAAAQAADIRESNVTEGQARSASVPEPVRQRGAHDEPEATADPEPPQPKPPEAAAPPEPAEAVAPSTIEQVSASKQRRAVRRARNRPAASRDRPAISGPSLRALDQEAQALWRRGDLAGAEDRFRDIIERDTDGSHAELAYGDLFSIADQAHGIDQRRELWRQYLAQFPRGRFADDARAALCRHHDKDTKAACWSSYLRDLPSGSYRGEAKAATGHAP